MATFIVKSTKLRCFHQVVGLGTLVGVLLGLLLIGMNQIMNMPILMSKMLMIVCKWHQALRMRSIEPDGRMQRMHRLLWLSFELVVKQVLVLDTLAGRSGMHRCHLLELRASHSWAP